MKRKFISNTYLRDIKKYQIKMYLDEDDYYIVVKKIIKADLKFIIKDNFCVIDDNYYVLEIVPKDENYAMRLFLDDKKKPLEYYFDICKNSNLDYVYAVPYYDDLYLDITVDARNNEINILDEKELNEALKINDITKEDYELVMKVKQILLEEISNGTNKLMNMNYDKYLF